MTDIIRRGPSGPNQVVNASLIFSDIGNNINEGAQALTAGDPAAEIPETLLSFVTEETSGVVFLALNGQFVSDGTGGVVAMQVQSRFTPPGGVTPDWSAVKTVKITNTAVATEDRVVGVSANFPFAAAGTYDFRVVASAEAENAEVTATLSLLAFKSA